MPTGLEVVRRFLGAIWPTVKALADLGLVIFAGTQVWLQNRDRRDRQRRALAVVFADRSRLQAKSLDWQDEDLLATARAGLFYPDDLPPPDWGTVVRSWGEPGPESSSLGATAYALLNQVIQSARIIAETKGRGTDAASGSVLQKHCKEVLEEVLKTLDDAIGAAPQGLSRVPFTLTDPKSLAGQQIAELYTKRLEQHNAPTGFWATRTGRALSTVGSALRL